MPAGDPRGFRFGLEAEYLLIDAESARPLWHDDLDFDALDAAMAAVPVGDLGPLDGLVPIPPHRVVSPFVVEGYHLPDPMAEAPRLVPKGVEVRTPARDSIDEAAALLVELLERLQRALGGLGHRAVALSHHPIADRFDGPQGARSPEGWRWAREAMMTYGPDVNIALPPALAGRIVPDDLSAKVDCYGPALAAMSLASPLSRGGLWEVDGRVGKAARTWRRAPVGRALERHPEQGGRLEFKSFEMTPRPDDFRAFLLLWLAVLLDDGLAGRAGPPDRVADLRDAAVLGLDVDRVRDRAAEVLDRAPGVLASFGFDPRPLAPFADRVATRRLPADAIIEAFAREGSIPGVLRHLAGLMEVEPGGIPG